MAVRGALEVGGGGGCFLVAPQKNGMEVLYLVVDNEAAPVKLIVFSGVHSR